MRALIIAALTFGLSFCSHNNNVSNCSSWCNFALNAYTPLGTTFQIGTNPIPGYVTEPSGPLQQGQTITLNYTINGNGPYSIHDPADIPPASITLFIWERGDDLGGGNTGKASFRFWCPQRAVLAPGSGTLSCKVDGNIWTNVVGLVDPNGFAQAILNVYGVGFTFGGRYFYGHGVTDGGTTFTINSFTVQ